MMHIGSPVYPPAGEENPELESTRPDCNPLDEVIVIDNWRGTLGDLILRISHLMRGAFRTLLDPIHKAVFRRGTKELKAYCFTQQYNDSCHISPLRNLEIIEKLREANFQVDEADFLSRREWLGENQKMLTAWHDLMAKLCKPDAAEKFPAMHELLLKSVQDAPVLPHFYNEKGETPFKGLRGAMEFGELPFFLIDVEALQEVKFKILCTQINLGEMISLDNLGLKTAIVCEKGVYKIYNQETRNFDNIDDLVWISLKTNTTNDGKTNTDVNIDWDKLEANPHPQYPLPPKGYQIKMQKIPGLGFQELGVVNELGGGFKFEKNGETHTFIPFQMSLMKLLFLASGVDENNKQIVEGHALFEAYCEFKELMAQNSDNLWHPEKLSKEKLLQYHLAEIFKKNPNLANEAEVVVDVAGDNWKNYKKLMTGEFYNGEKQLNPEGLELYVLGREQALAYYFMQSIRGAWYSSINPKVLVNSLELGLPGHLAPLAHEYLKAKLEKTYTVQHKDGLKSRVSFLSVWDQLRAHMPQQSDRKDFVSFDDHGWVVSLDPELIKKQNEGVVYDKKLLQRLGIAGIESWWGSDLSLWYKQAQVKKISTKKTMENPMQKV